MTPTTDEGQHAELLRAELSRITATWRCGCGATYSPEIALQPCDHSHRETWPHEWIGDRERELTGELLKRADEIKRLRKENDAKEAEIQRIWKVHLANQTAAEIIAAEGAAP